MSIKAGQVILFGTGTMAQMAIAYLDRDSDYGVEAFTIDKEYMINNTLLGLPVVPFEDVEVTYPPESYKMLIATGYRDGNMLRARKYLEAKAKGYTLISYVNSNLSMWEGIEIGDNCFLMDNLSIQPFVKIGNDVTIASGTLVAHNSTIGDHCFISSHVAIAGNTVVEPYTFLGVNSTISNGIRIAKGSVIGAGAVIVKDTMENGVYIGNPARLYDKGKIERVCQRGNTFRIS